MLIAVEWSRDHRSIHPTSTDASLSRYHIVLQHTTAGRPAQRQSNPTDTHLPHN